MLSREVFGWAPGDLQYCKQEGSHEFGNVGHPCSELMHPSGTLYSMVVGLVLMLCAFCCLPVHTQLEASAFCVFGSLTQELSFFSYICICSCTPASTLGS